jgi:hypothetical protein
MTSTYFFTYKLLSQGLLALPYIFYCFRKEIIEPTLFCVFGLPPNLIMPPSVQFGFFLGMRLCERRFGYLKGVVFM